MTILNKVKWVLGITVVFVIVLSTNLIDRNNFLRVNESISTIYQDRLVADDLIFDMMRCIHDKELALANLDSSFFAKRNEGETNVLQNYVSQYEFTKLTAEEEQLFDVLKKNYAKLQSIEQSFIAFDFEESAEFRAVISEVKKNLYDLSKIQLLEGKRESSATQRILETVELFTQLEIYLLIILAIIVQVMIIYNPKSRGEQKTE